MIERAIAVRPAHVQRVNGKQERCSLWAQHHWLLPGVKRTVQQFIWLAAEEWEHLVSSGSAVPGAFYTPTATSISVECSKIPAECTFAHVFL